MSFFSLCEIVLVWEFVPTLVLLVGLMLLWTRALFINSTRMIGKTYPILTCFNGVTTNAKRYSYYFHTYAFDPKSTAVIIKSNLAWLIALTLGLEISLNWNTWLTAESSTYFSGMLSHTPLVVCMKILILTFMWLSIIYLDPNEHGVNASTILLIGSVLFFMLVLVSANHFIVLYVALEGVSLLSFVLAAQPKTENAVESGLKYFFQSSFASVLLLLGIALTCAGTNSFDFVEIRWLLSVEPLTQLLTVGLSLITIALLFKVSSFPGHFWAPDVYRGPTSSVLTVFAVVVKLAAFFVLLNVYLQFLTLIYVNWSPLLYVASAASMLLGAIGAIRVINAGGNLRTFVAYTSINQVGFVLLGLTTVTLDGFWASLVYLIVYLLSSVLFLGVLSRIRFSSDNVERPIERLDELRHIFNNEFKYSRRFDLFVLAYAIWSMAGLPPLAGFFGKVALWSSLLHKLDSLVSGESATEITNSLPFVDQSLLIDPFILVAGILALSVVVSIISAVYYFKIYELLAPAASDSEYGLYTNQRQYWMIHDRGSLLLTVALRFALTTWVVFVVWTRDLQLFSYPPQIFDTLWSGQLNSLTLNL